MKIGVIGTGSMGRALGLAWARRGHALLWGSRDRAKAEQVAQQVSGAAAGTFDDAASFGEALLYTVRDEKPQSLLVRPASLAGKIVIDCNNSAIYGLDLPDPAGRNGISFPATTPSLAQRLADAAPQALIVKAFNTIPAALIELPAERLAQMRALVPVAGDDAGARATVIGLARELGFVAVDAGGLAQTPLIEGLADFIRYQLIAQGTPLGTVAWTEAAT